MECFVGWTKTRMAFEIERIAKKAKLHDYRMKSLIREVILSDAFVKAK